MSNVNLPIRIGVVGGHRGRSFANGASGQDDIVQLAAICDTDEAVLAEWKQHDGIRCYGEYDAMLDDDDVDAVCIATPVQLHASQAIAALRAGKHVLSEVTAAYTLEECWELIEAVEATGLTYMMAENYCFGRDVMMVSEMVSRGVFGDLITAEGSYLHDCRDLCFYSDGQLTWRGKLRKDGFFNSYPTHSIGPVSQWLSINRGDRYVSTATWHSNQPSVAHYVQRNKVTANTSLADPSAWKLPDTVTTNLRTAKGVLVTHRLDFASARPHHMNRYALQGTTASFTSNIDPSQESLVWIEDRSPTNDVGIADGWEPISRYADEFEHPLWKKHGDAARKVGHRGGDFFVVREFVDAIVEERPPIIDVYDAVTWSAITPLSQMSMEDGNNAVAFPDFGNSPS